MAAPPTSASTTTTTTTSSLSSTDTTTTTTTSQTLPPTGTTSSTTTTTTGITTDTTATTSSTGTSSTTTSLTTTSTSTTVVAPPPSTTSSITVVTTVTPTVHTSTSIVAVTPGLSTPTNEASNSSSKSFFDNKGAVAGVFTVVGLVVVALVIGLITNAIRRRRAKEFDREVAAAAAEAAAASAPAFLDDDDDDEISPYPNHHQPIQGDPYRDHQNGHHQYSDVSSHGTYSQPPLHETYNMRELGPSPGDVYGQGNSYAPGMDAGMVMGAAGAAGVGVARARSTRDPTNFASRFQDGAAPYAAFAGPAAFQSGAYGHGNAGAGGNLGYDGGAGNGNGHGNGNGNGMDITGVGAAGGTPKRGMSLSHTPPPTMHYNGYDHQYDPQQQQLSQPHHPQALYPAQQYPQQQQTNLGRNPSQATYHTQMSGGTGPSGTSSHGHYPTPAPHEADEDAYGGYTDAPEVEEEENMERPRVLKVANE